MFDPRPDLGRPDRGILSALTAPPHGRLAGTSDAARAAVLDVDAGQRLAFALNDLSGFSVAEFRKVQQDAWAERGRLGLGLAELAMPGDTTGEDRL